MVKSKSTVNTVPSPSGPLGRVVMPSPVRWKGTFHQWLRRTPAASRTFPTIWRNRCNVSFVGAQDSLGSGGNRSIAGAPPRGPAPARTAEGT